MKKTVIILLAIVGLLSCKKESAPTPAPQTKPLPVILKYDITQQLASFENNDSTAQIVGYVGNYGIKYHYIFTPTGTTDIIKGFGYVLVNNDTGSINFDISTALVIRGRQDFEGYHLYSKFDQHYGDFDVTPAILNSATTEFTVTKRSTGRSVTIPSSELISQGFISIRYD